jgi:hypothetical protein
MNADVLTTSVADGIAVITLGSVRRIYFDAEMGDALTEALEGFAGDPNVRVVIVTGGAPGYFNRHFNIPALIQIAESLRASGRQWPENATYNGGFFDKAMALCESMPKPVIAAITGTALAGAFEFALSCDLRIAEDGDYLIGLRKQSLVCFPVPAARKGCRAPSEHHRRSYISSWVNHSIHVKPKGRGWFTKPSAARLSIAPWRLRGACRRIRRNRSHTLSVSAMPTRRRWRRDWRSNEIRRPAG